MLSRFSDVLQTAADVLAPPATKLEDFEYHWKMVVNFYQNYDESKKKHVEDTRVPHHLHQMLQLIIDEEKDQQGGTVGPCLEAIVQRSIGLLDALVAISATDRPPGARAMALSLATALLRRTRQPCVNSPHVYRPLQRMLVQCNESPASPTEREEVELLLTLCGLVRKEPGLANIFTTPFIEDKANLLSIPEEIQQLIPMKTKNQTPKKNSLFEVDLNPDTAKAVSIVRVPEFVSTESVVDDNDSTKSQKTVYDDNDKFLLIDLLLSYLNSADNQVVLRACEGIMIVCSLPSHDVAGLVTCSPLCETLVHMMLQRFLTIPLDVDPGDVDNRDVTWAYVAQVFGDKSTNRFHGYRELVSFFSWLDYCDTLMKECHPLIASHLARIFRSHFLEAAADALIQDSPDSPYSSVWEDSRSRKNSQAQEESRHQKDSQDQEASRGRRDSQGQEASWGRKDSQGQEVSRRQKNPRHWFPQRALLTTAILSRCLRVVDSPDLINEFSLWLVGEAGSEGASEWPLLRSLVDACLTGDYHLTLDTLRFFEVILEKGTEHSMNRLVLSRICSRGYLSGGVGAVGGAGGVGGIEGESLQDERDRLNDMSFSRERERTREALLQRSHEEAVDAAFHALLAHEDPSDPGDPSDPSDPQHHRDPHEASCVEHAELHRVVNSFLLLLPRGVLSDPLGADYEHYVHDAQRHYQLWLDITSTYKWATIETEVAPSSAHSCDSRDSRPEADLHVDHVFDALHHHTSIDSQPENMELLTRPKNTDFGHLEENFKPKAEDFDEGPFLRMLFKLLSRMPDQPYQVNLHLTSIISKLALLPHPYLHEYLLNPYLPVSKKTTTLFKTLQDVARRITIEVPRIKNYRKIIENTRQQLMSEDPTYDEIGEHNQLVESLIVLEEFCKELAAIAFVKYQHLVHMQR